MDRPIEHVAILGGGTAGWLTACLLASEHCSAAPNGLRVTLIESARIPILGVGEGTWPSLRDTLRRIGLSENAFIRAASASFKQGTRFEGWRGGGIAAAEDIYFHPFSAPPSAEDLDLSVFCDGVFDGAPLADCVSPQIVLCREERAPKQIATPEYAAVVNYAYHLDAPAFAALLREHATTKLGVKLITDDVVDIRRAQDGGVASLVTQEAGEVRADLFVDCSGSRGLLIGEAMGAELTDVSDVLFNDRALALQVPYAKPDAPIQSQTNATATPMGWVWDIGLRTRRGVGHVFASQHASEDEARAAFQAYIDRTAPGVDARVDDARLISFRSAYRREAWRGNVIAIGMSQGFVEPLEASAIVMIELSATMLSDSLPALTGDIASAAARFNARFAYRWERIVEFLKLHYILSARDEPYWSAHRDKRTWPDRLASLLEEWRRRAPSREDFPQTLEIFTAASYAYILYGMGFASEAPATARRNRDRARAKAVLEHTRLTARRFMAGLPSNRALLDHINAAALERT